MASTGRMMAQPACLGLVHDAARGVGHVLLDQRLADARCPCACRKVLAMAPPITSASTLLIEIFQQLELGRDLGAADDGDTGFFGVSSAFASASSSACMVRPA